MIITRFTLIIASVACCLSASHAETMSRSDFDTCNATHSGRNPREVIDACTKLISGLPKEARGGAYINRGVAHLDVGEYDDAIDDFSSAYALWPQVSASLHERGAAYEKKGEFDKATADYTAYIKLEPNSWLAYEDRCRSRGESGRDLNAALEDCNHADNISHGKGTGWRGFVYLRMGKYAEAITDYTEALKIFPKSEYFLYGRGIARQRSGDTAGGAQDIGAAVAIRAGVAQDFARYSVVP